jgi:chorismate-pyruvate lyase
MNARQPANSGLPRTLSDCHAPDEAFAVLAEWFFEERLSIEGGVLVDAAQLPPAARDLLAHHEHMTQRLTEFHDRPMTLRVLHERRTGEAYCRCIHLLPQDLDQVVEFGIARIDLSVTTPAVRAAILERGRPLGDILMNSNVLRRIEPRWFFEFPAEAPMTAHFGLDHKGAVYGRLATIHCDEQPAVDLLEVITLHRDQSAGARSTEKTR